MKTTIIIIAVVVLGGLGFWATTNYQSDETINTTPATVTNTSTTTNTNSDSLSPIANTSDDSAKETTGTIVEVSISSSGFSPSSVTISVGDTVTWTNEDSNMHYVAPNNHPSHIKYADTWPDDGTGRIGGGQTYSYTFATAGTYDYHDHLSASLTGTVTVQ